MKKKIFIIACIGAIATLCITVLHNKNQELDE